MTNPYDMTDDLPFTSRPFPSEAIDALNNLLGPASSSEGASSNAPQGASAGSSLGSFADAAPIEGASDADFGFSGIDVGDLVAQVMGDVVIDDAVAEGSILSEESDVEDEDSDDDIDDVESNAGALALNPRLPDLGPSILMPHSATVKGRPTWEPVDSGSLRHKLTRALRAGLVRRSRFMQPIDLVIVKAGSEATGTDEPYGVEGDLARGTVPREVRTMLRLQKAIGPVSNVSGEPKATRPAGIATMAVLSDADHRHHIEALATREAKQAMRTATKGRASKAGPVQPALTDMQGRIQLLTVGEGVSVLPVRTAKDGGGKSLTAYASVSPRDAIDRQHQVWETVDVALRDSATPIVIPPIISIGGTSLDAYLAWTERPSPFMPKGISQYVTTTPQDKLSRANAVEATRKKMETVALMACTDAGSVINDVPLSLVDLRDGAVADFVELETVRAALEQHHNLQPVTMDRSDVLVRLKEHSVTIGKGTTRGQLFKFEEGSKETGNWDREPFQTRDIFLAHAMVLNRNQVGRYANGSLAGADLAPQMQHLTSRAFAQAYGRQAGEIMLRDEDLHRAKIKMAQVILYVPNDMEELRSTEQVARLENAMFTAVTEALGGTRGLLPVMVTTYRMPMEAHEYAIVGVRLMTHAKDVFDLLGADTPELWEKVLTGISIGEMDSHKGRGVIQQSHLFKFEKKALRSDINRGVPLLSSWADVLDRVTGEMYRSGYQPKNPDAWSDGMGTKRA
jgi:hypothetical protein